MLVEVFFYDSHVYCLSIWLLSLPELVLKCVWRQGSDTPHCTTSSGFDFDGRLSHTATVTISNTTKRHAGIYVCDYSLAAPQDLRECELHVKGHNIR